MAYSQKVIDHYENPRNVGSLAKDPNIDQSKVGVGMVGAPACGDVMSLTILVSEEGIITDARFKTYGCLTSNAPVNTPTCTKKIKDLKIGDEVLAWNGERIVNQKIRDIITHSVNVDDLLIIEFKRESSRQNINPGTFSLICTKEHIFWNANNKPIEAQQLQLGQELYEITEHELRIQTESGPASPDFIVPGKKKCIEVYTKQMPKFMQDRSEESNYVADRRKQLATAGYDSLFLAVEDIAQSLPEVQNFIHNGMEIVGISAITHQNQLRGCERDGKLVVVYDLKLEDGAHVFFSNRVGSHNCGSAIASSSLLTEWVKGKTLDQAGKISNSEIAEELALPPVKIHCSILAEDAIKAAIADYKNKHDIVN